MILVIFRLRVTKAEFNTYQLFPVADVGMRGKMSGISIAASGRLKYSYKKGWFKVSDTMRFSAKTRNIHADLTLSVGKIKISDKFEKQPFKMFYSVTALKYFKNLQEWICDEVFFSKIADFRSATLQNRECILDYIPRFLRNISE